MTRSSWRMFFMNGGHGARPDRDGPSCLSFPSNVANTPIEQFENTTPMIVREKALIPDSGGAGKFRGGLAQRLLLRGDEPGSDHLHDPSRTRGAIRPAACSAERQAPAVSTRSTERSFPPRRSAP